MSRANYDPPPSPSLAAWPRRVPFSPFPVTTSAVLRKRLVVVIDGTNLKGALDRRGLTTWVRYRQLAIEIAKRVPKEVGIEPWALEKVIYVTAPPIQSHNPSRYERWRKFEAMLKRTERLSLLLGRLEGSPGRIYEKGVDILVALELLRGAYKDEYDAAILVAADGDYADVAHAVREAGKVFVNSFFEDVKSYELLNASDAFVNLSHVRWESIRLQQDRRY